ncbi:MAG TPA: phosphatase PAP2 family protein [Actinomycetota bacterium]
MGATRFVWAGALAAGACAIGLGASKGEDGPDVDRELFALVNRDHGPEADRVFAGITELGSLYAAGAAAGVLLAAGRRRAAFRALGAAGVTWLALQGIKRVVVRPRPSDIDPTATRLMIARPKGSSWPSSHPAVLTTFTRVATRELRSGAAARTAFTGLDLGVATSRVYLGVHYPSDVASGLLFGRAMARLWPRGRS